MSSYDLKKLEAVLPPELQAYALVLFELLNNIAEEKFSQADIQQRIRENPSLVEALHSITGEKIYTTHGLLSIGSKSQTGDIQIRDQAGGNITTININLISSDDNERKNLLPDGRQGKQLIPFQSHAEFVDRTNATTKTGQADLQKTTSKLFFLRKIPHKLFLVTLFVLFTFLISIVALMWKPWVQNAQYIQIYEQNSGSIKHVNPETYAPVCADVNVQNFITEVTFTNPYGWDEYAWSNGIFFRYNSIHNYYRITIDSSERLRFAINRDGVINLISSGIYSIINRSAGEYNKIRIEAINSEAKIYINNEFVTTLSIGESMTTGKICLATGMLGEDSIPGKETLFSNFRIHEYK